MHIRQREQGMYVEKYSKTDRGSKSKCTSIGLAPARSPVNGRLCTATQQQATALSGLSRPLLVFHHSPSTT